MYEEIIFAGFGGQGVLLMGKFLAQACMDEGLHVTWMPSYGAEVRGGTAHSMVVVSDDAIASPVVFRPSCLVAMNEPSLAKFEPKLLPGGLLILNSSLIKRNPKRKDVEVAKVPATDIASDLENAKASNMVALGAYCAKRKIIPLEKLVNSLPEVIPPHRQSLLKVNEAALRKGYLTCRRPAYATPGKLIK